MGGGKLESDLALELTYLTISSSLVTQSCELFGSTLVSH